MSHIEHTEIQHTNTTLTKCNRQIPYLASCSTLAPQINFPLYSIYILSFSIVIFLVNIWNILMNFDVCFNFGGWQAATMSLQDERKMIKIKLHSNWKNMLFFSTTARVASIGHTRAENRSIINILRPALFYSLYALFAFYFTFADWSFDVTHFFSGISHELLNIIDFIRRNWLKRNHMVLIYFRQYSDKKEEKNHSHSHWVSVYKVLGDNGKSMQIYKFKWMCVNQWKQPSRADVDDRRTNEFDLLLKYWQPGIVSVSCSLTEAN